MIVTLGVYNNAYNKMIANILHDGSPSCNGKGGSLYEKNKINSSTHSYNKYAFLCEFICSSI